MAIKVNARETELKFGKEATYHSAMIWKMKQIRRFLRHKKGTQIPWITQIWSLARLMMDCIARNQNKSIKILGQSPEIKSHSLLQKICVIHVICVRLKKHTASRWFSRWSGFAAFSGTEEGHTDSADGTDFLEPRMADDYSRILTFILTRIDVK